MGSKPVEPGIVVDWKGAIRSGARDVLRPILLTCLAGFSAKGLLRLSGWSWQSVTYIDRALLPITGAISLGLLIRSIRKAADNHPDHYRTTLQVLQANPEQVEAFRSQLDQGEGFKVNFVRSMAVFKAPSDFKEKQEAQAVIDHFLGEMKVKDWKEIRFSKEEAEEWLKWNFPNEQIPSYHLVVVEALLGLEIDGIENWRVDAACERLNERGFDRQWIEEALALLNRGAPPKKGVCIVS